MKFWVGVTDNQWFEFLSKRNKSEKMLNKIRPSDARF